MGQQPLSTDPQPLLENLVAEALRHLVERAYAAGTIDRYRRDWKALLGFSRDEAGTEVFSEEVATRFLASRDTVDRSPTVLPARKRAVRVLSEFWRYGCFRQRPCTPQKSVLPPGLQGALQDYQVFSADLGLSPRTMRVRIQILTSFLQFVEARGHASLGSIRPALLSGFVSSLRRLKSGTVFENVSALRSFFRYLFMEGLTPKDFSQDLPSVRVRRRDEQIPFVWTRSEVEALLGAVERDSPLGKRNYAILLLACRLGLRVGDIRDLCLDHLLWDASRVEFSQGKTGAVLTLPMSEEVGRALIDYLRHGRPTSTRREVFLRHRAPFEPFSPNANLHSIVTLYRRRAGIEATRGRSRGMHSLRHTLASHLLEADTPIETIADILGHRSVESTRVYTKVDLHALRSVALDPQEVADA